MDIIKKEHEILEKLEESGYSTFGGDKEKALGYLEEQMKKVMLYGEDERAASGLEALNKICADLGLTSFADVDTGNMQAVEEFVGQCRQDIYNRGIGKGQE